jgi:PAS domain S-box-containing protein
MSPPWWAESNDRTPAVRSAIGYACALISAWLAALLTIHLGALHGTPVALNFVVLAGVTTMFGIRQGVVNVLATAAFFYFPSLLPVNDLHLYDGRLIRTLVILVIGLFIAYLCERYRRIGIRLRSTLAALGEHADTLAQAQQASHSAAWVFNADDRSLRWAHGGAELLGRPSAEVTHFDALLALMDSEDRGAVERAVAHTATTSAPFHAEFRVGQPGGELRWLEVRGTPSAHDAHWRGVVLDVTSRKHAEIALLRAEKLAAIGRLSATVAHEINNPLESVTNLLFLAASAPELSEQTLSYLDTAEQELKRLASIARHTLTFARINPVQGPTEAVPLSESVVAMFQTRCHSRGGHVRFHADPDLFVDVPADELRQILINVMSNACDAITGPDGLVDVAIATHSSSLTIVVRDTGSGIPAENLEHIFDPFFTTKDDFGTGIGLWVTRELVVKNGGRITARSGDQEPPFRTAFLIEFPLSASIPSSSSQELAM